MPVIRDAVGGRPLENKTDLNLAVSYASEDGDLVHSVIACLKRRAPHLKIFCYGLTGRLADHTLEASLDEVFGNSQQAVFFVSDHFSKPLTLHEFRRIFGRFRSGKMPQLLLARLGDLDLPELASTYSWVDLRLTTIPVLVERLLGLFGASEDDSINPLPFDPLWETIKLSQGLADGLEGRIMATQGLSCCRSCKPNEENEPDVLLLEDRGLAEAFVSFEIESRTTVPALIIRSGENYDEWPRPIDAFAYVEWNQELGLTLIRVYNIRLSCAETETLMTYDELLEVVSSQLVRLLNQLRSARGELA